MTLQIDENGVLRQPNVHDGHLIGINTLEGGFELLIRTVESKIYKVILPNLVRLKADNFCEGNIIFEILIYQGSDCPQDLVRRVYSYSEEELAVQLPKSMQEITDNGWTLLELTSSYGCELVALSKNASGMSVEEL